MYSIRRKSGRKSYGIRSVFDGISDENRKNQIEYLMKIEENQIEYFMKLDKISDGIQSKK